MPRLACTMTLAALALVSALPLAAESAIPDLRGTWKGESRSIVLGGGNRIIRGLCRASRNSAAFRSRSQSTCRTAAAFPARFHHRAAMRRLLLLFRATARSSSSTTRGYTVGTILSPTRMELCYMLVSTSSRIASCSELVKQP